MSKRSDEALEIFKNHIGVERGPGNWYTVDQNKIKHFADITQDHYFIHVDPKKAAELSPYKTTVAHGFLTLSLLGELGKGVPPLEPNPYQGAVVSINYGLNRVRFPAAVRVNSRIRLRSVLLSVEKKGPATLQTVNRNTIEIEGEEKPACVAEGVGLVTYGEDE